MDHMTIAVGRRAARGPRSTPAFSSRGALLRLLAPRSLAEHVFHRRAYRFIRTMNTTDPATRTALALSKVRAHPVDMLTSCFRHLRGDHPADPFIARKRCETLPCRKCPRVGRQGAP